MLSHSRFLWTVVGALALVGIGRAAEVDRYLPKETEHVVVVNVKQLVASPLVKKNLLPQIEEQLKANKDYKAIQQATGLDLLRDVHTVTIGNTGTTGEKVTIIVRGTFDVDKIAKVAEGVAKEKKDEFKIGKLGDRPLYEGSKDGKTTYFTFIDGTTLVGSTIKDNVVDAVEGKGGKLDKDLAGSLQALDGKQSIFMAGLIPEEGKANLGQAQALKKVKVVSGSLNITNDVMASLSLITGDAKSAKEVGELANQFKGMIAIAGQSNEMFKPFADELLKTLKIQTTQSDVRISFKLGEDIIKKALEMIPR